MTDVALRLPLLPAMPVETGRAAVKACAGLWQVAQETLASEETRGSKNRSQPSSALAGVYGLSSGQTIGTSPSGTCGPSGGNSTSAFVGAATSCPKSVVPRAVNVKQMAASQDG